MSVENIPSNEINRSLPETELMGLGELCVAASERVDLAQVMDSHEQFTDNPNTAGPGLFIAGEVSMNSDNVYRQVGFEAVQDLAQAGIVRNGSTAQGKPHKRWGHRVFWNEGADGKKISTGGRFIIESTKEAVADGWVTADKVVGIHTRTQSGEIIDILKQS